jgi:hypothetical protein
MLLFHTFVNLSKLLLRFIGSVGKNKYMTGLKFNLVILVNMFTPLKEKKTFI